VRAARPDVDEGALASFRANLWDGPDFVITATREQVAACDAPLLVMMGDDEYHPASVSREIARLAPNATLVERWKEPDLLEATDAAIRGFLARHTP
jgi:pimeloyl-ACP methyl ester carboxylesterase